VGDVTVILNRIEHGEPEAAEELLPLVYQQLRKLAAARMAQERPAMSHVFWRRPKMVITAANLAAGTD
jgi:hypothetical protein